MEGVWKSGIEDHLRLVQFCLGDKELMASLDCAARLMATCLDQGGKIMLCGNGGSASDSEHLAAEFTGRFRTDRNPLPAIALTSNTSQMSAIANDYGYEEVFSRLVAGLAKPGDVLIAFSTSGRSPNVLKALSKAKDRRVKTVFFGGSYDSEVRDLSDCVLRIPHTDTARIQEVHILLGHLLCQYLESRHVENLKQGN